MITCSLPAPHRFTARAIVPASPGERPGQPSASVLQSPATLGPFVHCGRRRSPWLRRSDGRRSLCSITPGKCGSWQNGLQATCGDPLDSRHCSTSPERLKTFA